MGRKRSKKPEADRPETKHKIKLIKIMSCGSSYDCDYDCNCTEQVDSMSEWQEVTSKELEFLKDYNSFRYLREKGVKVVVLEDITAEKDVQDFIHDIKSFVAEEIDKENKRKMDYARKERERKRLAEKRKVEKAMKILESKGLI